MPRDGNPRLFSGISVAWVASVAFLLTAFATISAQVSYEQAIADLASPEPSVRQKAVGLLKDAAYPEAAIPMAALVADPQNAIQFDAIAAELNIFLAERVVTHKRVGYVVEKRSPINAEATFSAGPLAIGARVVPVEVLTALRTAMHDDNPRVELEAIYAFGALAPTVGGAARRDLLRAAGPDLISLLGSLDPFIRFAGVRVIGRLFELRPNDEPIDETVGDAVVAAMNDKDQTVKAAVMQALGTMRYERAVTALSELFAHYAKGQPAEAALDALAHIANPVSAPLLATQLISKTSALRGIAVEGLARIGDLARLAEMQVVLKDERTDTVLLALAFASTLLSNAPIDPMSEAVTRTKTRDQARQYLIEIAPGHIGLFDRQLVDPDARVRLAAVDALGLTRDPAAVPLVQPLTADTDPLVAQAAARAMDRLTTPR
jgi:HEAT repeat protein